MPYPDPNYVQEVKERYGYTPNGLEPLLDRQIDQLNFDFRNRLVDLGIPVEDDTVPETEGVPRIFILGLDENGDEKPFSLAESNIKFGSREFWEAARLGNVFAYPAGSKDPVQIQPDIGLTVSVKYSNPVTDLNVPKRQMKEPSLWAKMWNTLSGGRWFKEVTVYNKQKDARSLKESLRDLADKRSNMETDELKAAADYAERKKAEKAKKRVASNLATVRTDAVSLEKGYENASSIYAPIPQKKAHLLTDDNKNRLYTEEEFNDIEVIGKDQLDLSEIIIGDKDKGGRTATEKDFVAVALLNIKPLHKTAAGYGYDLYRLPCGRPNSGGFFKEGLNDLRRKTKDAFNAYKAGDKSKLGKMLADAVIDTCDTVNDRVQPPRLEAKAQFDLSATLLDMMNADPELKTEAMKYGMTEEHYTMCENLKTYLKLEHECNEARVKLGEAVYNGETLSKEEKEKCTKAIIKKVMIDQKWSLEVVEAHKETGDYSTMNKTVLGLNDTRVFDKLTDEVAKDYYIGEQTESQLFEKFFYDGACRSEIQKKMVEKIENIQNQMGPKEEIKAPENKAEKEIGNEIKEPAPMQGIVH